MRHRDFFHAGKRGLAVASIILSLPGLVLAAPARKDPVASTTTKTVAPIAISYEIDGTPRIGQPLDLTVSVSVDQAMSDGSVSVTADDPLAVIEPLGPRSLGDVEVGGAVDVGVTVLPLADQTHYMNVTVRGTIGGLSQSRSINVPIRLQDAELRKAENDEAGKSGERVRSFGAVETVH